MEATLCQEPTGLISSNPQGTQPAPLFQVGTWVLEKSSPSPETHQLPHVSPEI